MPPPIEGKHRSIALLPLIPGRENKQGNNNEKKKVKKFGGTGGDV